MLLPYDHVVWFEKKPGKILIHNIDEKSQPWIRFWPIDQFFGCCEKSSKNDDVPSVLHPRPNLYIILDSFLFVVMGKNINCLNMFNEISATFESFQHVFFSKQKEVHWFKWRFNSHSANGQPLNFLGTKDIFTVVGKIRCNLLFHGPLAEWELLRDLPQATPGPCGSCRCRPCGGIHSKSSTSNSAEVEVGAMDFCFGDQPTTQPTNQPFPIFDQPVSWTQETDEVFPKYQVCSTEIEAAAPATATTSATPTAEVQTCTVYVGRISAEACGIRGRIGIGGFFWCHDLDVSGRNT